MEQNSDLFTIISAALSPDDAIQIQTRLWELLASRTERYTTGGSSSVRVEIAEELLKSICFSIGLCINGDVARLKTENLQEILEQSWRKIEQQIKIGKELLGQARITAPKIENISYRDTLIGMEQFFKRYDYRFFAHEIPCDIDYQLCLAVPKNLLGVEYFCEYLRRIIIENAFCNRFLPETAIKLLGKYCPDYRGLLINLYEPIATNAIGCALLGLPINSLCIPQSRQGEAAAMFENLSTSCAEKKLRDASLTVCAELNLHPEEEKYLCAMAENLAPRVIVAAGNNNLGNVFLEF